MNGFSIVVCCYNSSSRIQETLWYLFRLKKPGEVLFEIIVVNNNSSDNTTEMARQAEELHNNDKVPFRIMEEPKAGLIHARKKGIASSTYDWIIFCDDDNHLDERYLVTVSKLVAGKNDVAIYGGWCKPKLPFYPGKWIEANYPALAIEPSPKLAGYVDWVFGAGMIVKKELFYELQSRSIELILTGRVGKKQTSGDDAELCHLARFIGYKVYYDPALILFHCVSARRLTKRNFIKSNYKNVFMVIYFYLLDMIIKDRSITGSILYKKFLQTRLRNTFYYLPRIVFGKNAFFSFMMFFQNLQAMAWALGKKNRFINLHQVIVNNLFVENGRK
jgi:glycosyltransferase involved in cell wall biosynthesis